MPLATNPKRTVAAWLACDAEIPEETRPVFLCRFLTSFELDALYEEFNAIVKVADYDERNLKLSAFLAKGVVGWRNMTAPQKGLPGGATASIDFAPAHFDHVLSVEEKYELADLMLTRPRITEREQKKLPSSAPTGPSSSAPPAEQPATADQEPAQKTS